MQTSKFYLPQAWFILFIEAELRTYRAVSRFAASLWETAWLCKDVSHWLGASLASALIHASEKQAIPGSDDYSTMIIQAIIWASAGLL